MVFNVSGFVIYLVFDEYDRVTQGSEYAWIIPEDAWLGLNIAEYVWICRNMRDYT